MTAATIADRRASSCWPSGLSKRSSASAGASTTSIARAAARNILAARLATMVEHGSLGRHAYREPARRPRSEYRLTDKGREWFPALVALMQWGDHWTADPEGAAVELRHDDCGATIGVDLRCGAGHGSLTARDVVPEPGPGALAAA